MKNILILSLFLIGCGRINADYIKVTRNPDLPVIITEPASNTECPTGGSRITQNEHTIILCNGSDGAAGPTGATGNTGAPGGSCHTEQLANGAIITCEDGSSAIITDGIAGNDGTDGVDGENGQDGSDGSNGEDGQDLAPGQYDIAAIYNPCGDGPGYDEVLLVLANGQILAHYAGGGNLQFLSLIGPGSYRTTDQQSCHFTVNANGTISY